MEKTTFELSKPITAHGDELKELQVRRPTPQDCRQIKAFPYELNHDGLPIVEPEVAARYMALCCAIPASSVDQLALVDFNSLAWQIVGFFITPESAASPSTSDLHSI